MSRHLIIRTMTVGLRVALGIVLVATMIVATRFGWYSPRFHIPYGLRPVIVLTTAALLTALAATCKRCTLDELFVMLVTLSLIGILLIPSVGSHTGEPVGEWFLW